MIFTDDFVFVHFTKTGGSFVTVMLEKLYKKYPDLFFHNYHQDAMQHAECYKIPSVHKGKPVISCKRNPYDRYVSLYRFGWWKIRHRYEAKILIDKYPHYPNITFEEYVKTSCETCRDPKWNAYGLLTSQHIEFFSKSKFDTNIINPNFIKTGQYKKYLYDVKFLKQENLHIDLHNFVTSLNKFKPEDTEFILDNIKHYPNDGRGGHGDRKPDEKWEDFYTPELKRYVRNKERLLFELFPEYDK